MNQRRWTFVLYYIVCASAIAIFLGRTSWLFDYRLLREGVETQARVTAVSCKSSAPLSFRFSIGGKNYEGSGDGGFGNPPCIALKPGDQVAVYYLSSRPEINLPGNPQDRLLEETAGIAMVAILAPLVLLFFLFLAVRRFGNAGSSQR